jgi:hypothetical protein
MTSVHPFSRSNPAPAWPSDGREPIQFRSLRLKCAWTVQCKVCWTRSGTLLWLFTTVYTSVADVELQRRSRGVPGVHEIGAPLDPPMYKRTGRMCEPYLNSGFFSCHWTETNGAATDEIANCVQLHAAGRRGQ